MAVRFQRSHNTDRALATAVRPTLRGVSHRAAAILSVPAGVWLVLASPTPRAQATTAVFAVCITAMFTISAIVHYRTWGPHTTEVLFRLDHTGIYLAIAGTATPIAMFGLHGWHRPAVLFGVWGVAAVGTVVEWWPARTPRGLHHTLYLVTGWATIPFLPAVVDDRGWGTGALLLGGGLLYTVGAVVVAVRRPDPAPLVFGYHEIWHLLVVGAVVLHYAMVGATLLPAAGAT